jgi:hypothetical protein
MPQIRQKKIEFSDTDLATEVFLIAFNLDERKRIFRHRSFLMN